MAIPKVGGELDAFCTRCKLTLGHTILAMVGTKIARVRCNTCGGDHTYRSAPGASRPSSSSTAARASAPREGKVVMTMDQQLAGRDLSKAKSYSPKETFVLDDVVNHPTFGLGIVTAVRNDKVDVAFKLTQKTLIHARTEGASAAKPAFSPPHAVAQGPADKAPLTEASENSASEPVALEGSS